MVNHAVKRPNYWKIGCLVMGGYITLNWCLSWLSIDLDLSWRRGEELGDPLPRPLDSLPLPPLPVRKLTNLRDNTGTREPSSYTLYNLTAEVPASDFPYDCVVTKTTTPFHVCAYEAGRDKYISASVRSTGLWEPYITPVIEKALLGYPNAMFIDVGANIGYYSFLAAKLGHGVIAVEPSIENAIRFHKGAQLNRLQNHISLLLNALLDRHLPRVTLTSNPDNQGGVWIKSLTRRKTSKPPVVRSDRATISATTLTSLLTVTRFSTAILKLDIEGFECLALKSPQQFLRAVYVPYIFMEWKKMYDSRARDSSPCPAAAMQKLSGLLSDSGYEPVEVRTGFILDPERSTTAWRIGDLYWKHRTALQLQEPY